MTTRRASRAFRRCTNSVLPLVVFVGCGVSSPTTESKTPDLARDASSDGPPEGAVESGPPSQSWAWSLCGTLLPATPDSEVAISPDGRHLAVVDQQRVARTYLLSAESPPTPVAQKVGAMAFSPDSSVLALQHPDDVLALYPLTQAGRGESTRTLGTPMGVLCGRKQLRFSPAGDKIASFTAGDTCIWQTSDGAFLGSLPGDAADVAFRGETILTIARPLVTATTTTLLTRSIGGERIQERVIPWDENSDALSAGRLSPTGALLALANPPTLLNLDTDEQLLPSNIVGSSGKFGPTFSSRGDRVVLPSGVFRTSDGAKIVELPGRSYLGEQVAFADDGDTAASVDLGLTCLSDFSSTGALRCFGAPPLEAIDARSAHPISTISVSADGKTLVSQVFTQRAVGVRIAPSFENSNAAWWAATGDTTLTADLSRDGSLAAVSGDNSTLFSAKDGSYVWGAAAPSLSNLRCWGTQLRISSTSRWAAQATYFGTLAVFSTAPTMDLPRQIVGLPNAQCHEVATFSRDDQIMVTSRPAAYRTGERAEDWTQLWAAEPTRQDGGASRMGVGGYEEEQRWSDEVRLSPDEKTLLVSNCYQWDCAASLRSMVDGAVLERLTELTAPHPSFSPEGDWIVAGPVVRHLPSHAVQTLETPLTITTSTFAPNGDIIAGTSDQTLLRYCRHP